MGKRSRASRSVRVVLPDERRSRADDDTRPRKIFRNTVLRTNAITRKDKQAEDDYARNIEGFDENTLSALGAMRGELAAEPGASHLDQQEVENSMDLDTAMDEDEEEWEDVEDGVELDDQAMREVLEFAKGYRQYDDKRTWRQRVQRSDEHWKQAMPLLVNAYLRWRYPPPASPERPPTPAAASSDSNPQDTASSELPLPPRMHDDASNTINDAHFAPSPLEPFEFTMDIYDIFTTATTAHISSTTATSHLEALALHGYLGASPVRPSVAISFTTLELLRSIRLFKASYSIESFAKLVCHYYCIPYRRTVRNWISDTFDIYLALLRDIKKSIDRVLGRDAPDWRVRNSCPACTYTLVDEAPRAFSRMYCMDGNNSLKRMRTLPGRNTGDTRVFEDGDYFLSQDFVDTFANEVRVRPGSRAGDDVDDALPWHPDRDNPPPLDPDPSVPLPLNQPCTDAGFVAGPSGGTDHANPGAPTHRAVNAKQPGDQVTVEGDPTDGVVARQSTCTKNWKAAQSDDKKQHSWEGFDLTGIFASACRHGFILWITDMVQSGELAKYPLAIVAKVLDVMGERTLGGYDVGCSFGGTVRRSSLGERFDQLRSRICVNAFHGYSHEYSCQVKHHPNGIKGMGLEDLETLERIFSASNALAAIVRYASPYRRRVLIEAFFQQWDNEKYLNLGKMLCDNYRQALGIIKEQSLVVVDAMASLGLTPEDLSRYAAEEREYLDTVGKESPQDLHEIAYVEALQELRMINSQLARTNRQFLAASPTSELTFMPPHNGPTNYEAETSKTRKIETDRRYLDARRKVLMLEVADLEIHLGIGAQWQPSDPDYMRVSRYIATRKYQKALAHLQRLVVQRLFELHKMNLARTGYRMRRHIAKNMQTRSRALRNALQAYNTAAAALDPPRPKLDWDTISHYQLLQEFDLLNETRADIREKPWAQPAVRETLRLSQRLDRAREEIDAVHCEARRLHTAIRDENILFSDVLRRLEDSRDPLYGALAEFVARRRGASAHVMIALQKLYALPGFSGTSTPGLRVGASPAPLSTEVPEFQAVLEREREVADSHEGRGQDVGVEDDAVQQELTDFTDFMGTLGL